MPNTTPETFSYTLVHPFSARGKSYTALTIRRPLVRDLIAAERQPGDVGGSAALIAACADVPFADLGHMDAADYRGILRDAKQRDFFGGDEMSASSSSPSTPGPAGD